LDLKYLIPFFLSLNLLASSDTPLSKLNKDDIEIDKQIDDKKSTNLKYSWIKPVIASYSYTINDQFSVKNKTRYFRVSLEQPVFKSGGIYFAIKYSDASREFSNLVTNLKEQNLIKKVYETLLNLKKIDLQLEKTSLQIKNAKIDIVRKQEQFDSGLLDSSFLDSAILNRSKLDQLKLDLQNKRATLLSTFHNLSDADYKSVTLPKFQMVSKDEFMSKNIELQSARSKRKQAKYLKNMTISNYLPTLSLFGEYSNKDDSFKIFKQQSSEYKNYGVRVSMPIADLNMMRNIEIEKLKYIKSKIALTQKRRELENSFELFNNQITTLQNRADIAKKDIALYDRLVRVTDDGVKAGDKTKLDLDTLQNSKNISQIEAKIYDRDIQLLFLDLYAKMSDAI
jgi:outer membrane protein TolC